MDLSIRVMHEEESRRYMCYSLALFESWEEEPVGFEFQHDLREPDDPRACKPPTYCVVDGQHRSSFGGVLRAEWGGDCVGLRFTDLAVQELGLTSNEVMLFFDAALDGIDAIKKGLIRVLSFGPAGSLPELAGFVSKQP
ncbi:hypothetical protein AB0M41_40135 [Streptomyces sp. NPDC051896]|uniref:hypothetical protein n=1 Tax=Streptomyces sp. NPDC051896 TaxID=3155416 RepID=UPI00341F8995